MDRIPLTDEFDFEPLEEEIDPANKTNEDIMDQYVSFLEEKKQDEDRSCNQCTI